MNDRTINIILFILISVISVISVPIQGYFGFDSYLTAFCITTMIICIPIGKLSQWWEQRLMRTQQIKEEQLGAEKRQNAEAKQKVEALQKQYMPQLIPTSAVGSPFSISTKLANKEVVSAVKRYKNNFVGIYDRYSSAYNELRTILLCEGCRTESEKYTYLNENIEKIKVLKNECDAVFASKVMLLNEDAELMFELKLAFQYLQNSKKCVSSGAEVKMFVSSPPPQELNIFRYENEPAILFLGQHYFCLFSNVILVFDRNGIFVNAIDPSALRVDVKRMTVDIVFRNGESSENQYIAEDSKCIKQGEEIATWLHTCRDGSPDLRYRNNPFLRYRTDTYEYAIIKFMIGEETISFGVSSSIAIDAFDEIKSKYIRTCHNKTATVSQLLQLIETVGDKEDACLMCVVEAHRRNVDKNSCFCKLVEI